MTTFLILCDIFIGAAAIVVLVRLGYWGRGHSASSVERIIKANENLAIQIETIVKLLLDMKNTIASGSHERYKQVDRRLTSIEYALGIRDERRRKEGEP